MKNLKYLKYLKNKINVINSKINKKHIIDTKDNIMLLETIKNISCAIPQFNGQNLNLQRLTTL